MAQNKIQTGLRLSEVTYKKIIYISRNMKRSLNAQIEYEIEQAIVRFEKEHGAIPVEENAG